MDEALARLMDGVNAEPVSDRLRDLARQLADALAEQKNMTLAPDTSPDREASAG